MIDILNNEELLLVRLAETLGLDYTILQETSREGGEIWLKKEKTVFNPLKRWDQAGELIEKYQIGIEKNCSHWRCSFKSLYYYADDPKFGAMVILLRMGKEGYLKEFGPKTTY